MPTVCSPHMHGTRSGSVVGAHGRAPLRANLTLLVSLRRVAMRFAPPGCRGFVFGRACAAENETPHSLVFLPFPCGLLLAAAEGAGSLPAVEGAGGWGPPSHA